jgi:hypothetical protein
VSQTLEWAGIIAASGVVGSFFTYGFNWWTSKLASKKVARRTEAEAGKFDADAVQAITTAAVALVVPLQTQITELLRRVDALEEENTKTKTLLQIAIEYIRALRAWVGTHTPDLSPPDPPALLGL